MIVPLLLMCGARRAWADRAVVVDLDGLPPFAAGELAAALRVRVGAGDPVRVRVIATDDGVIVEANGASRRVRLGGRAGADAARLVALAATDLLFDDLAIAPEPPPSPPGLTAQVVAPAAAARAPRFTVGVVGAAAAWDGVLGGVTGDLAVTSGREQVALDVGGATLSGSAVHLTSAVVRLSGGVRTRWIDLRAGLTLAPVSVSDGVGDTTVLVGAGASARLRVPIGDGLRAVVAAGVDAFATRTEYQLDTMTVATPWVAPWIAAGIEVTP